MSIQWTGVAGLLYFEIGLAFLLCLPILKAKRWKSLFSIKIFSFLDPVWRILYYSVLLLLVILFLDSIREMNKFRGDNEYDARANLETKLDTSLKRFRAQRNFYVSGMTLFLIVVIRRLIALLSEHANLEAQHEAALKMGRSASAEAERLRAEAEKSGSSGKVSKEETSELKEELERTNMEMAVLKKQAANNEAEYDRLAKENQKLQQELYVMQGKDVDKKDH
ncbi:B-cell receptor-associated protein 29-like [Dysidea avara]|uniref:B-cell receptor-associated protein 29-like n=1 Tax=Dysidea avara TaxID=196820 RepID=UPI00332E50FE